MEPISKVAKSKDKRRKKASKFDHYFPSAKKHQDNIKLLLSHQKFQTRIKEIRKRLGIPEDGFADSQEKHSWTKRMLIECDTLSDSPKFKQKEKIIRDAVKAKEISLKEANDMLHKLYAELPVNYRSQSIRSLIKEFNLPENYEFHLGIYLASNKAIWPGQSFSIGPYDSGDKITEARYVPVRIYAKLTDDDLQELKYEVNQLFGKNLPAFQNLRDLDKKLEIERLLKEEAYDLVSKKSYKLNAEDIAERVLKNPKKKGEIYITKQGLKKLRKNRFGKQ